jgi:hypothetical protein
MRLSFRLSALAAVAIAALGPAAIPAAAASAPTPAGSQLWAARFRGISGKGAAAYAAVASPDSAAVFVTGDYSHRGGAGDSGETVAYNATTGATLWRARYAAGGHNDSSFDAIAISPTGSVVFVTGETSLTPGGSRTDLTVAYNASTGAQLWAVSPAFGTGASSIAASTFGAAVYVTGGGGTVAYNATTGATLWTADTGVTGGTSDGVSPNGKTVYVTGSAGSSPSGTSMYKTAAYNAATGASRWTVPSPFQSRALAVDQDGSEIVVTGDTGHPGTSSASGATVAYSAATGAKMWDQGFTSKYGFTEPLSVAMNHTATLVFVTGFTTVKGGSVAYRTVAYDATTGTTAWARHVGSESADAPPTLAVSPLGTDVYVTGSKPNAPGAGSHYATVAYNTANGTVDWTARYPSQATSHALAITVSPDGTKAFVTGFVAGQRADVMTTVAYSTGDRP